MGKTNNEIFTLLFLGNFFSARVLLQRGKVFNRETAGCPRKKVPFFLKFQLFVGHDDHLDHFGRSWTLLDCFGSQ